jgi:phosphoglycerate dehydrogenase-like enzyme
VLGPDGLHELLRHSDMIVVTASLNPSSRGLLDERELGLMKPGSRLVSTSLAESSRRTPAAPAGLIDGRLGGVMLAVTEIEPFSWAGGPGT